MTLRSFFAGRRALFGVWLLLCAIAVVLLLKLSVFMVDPARRAYSMLPGNESLTAHSCLSAYVAAADRLGEPGNNLYDPQNYRRKGDDAKRRIPIGGFEQDKYEYPPPFLLLPRALLLASRDFRVVRALWFFMSIAAVLGAMRALAAWIGGRRGLATALLSPLCWASFIHLMTLQQGNIQFVIFTISIAAMIAFDKGRPALGGALLAFAIGTKLYPGLLLLMLLTQRRLREALFVLGFGLLFCVLLLIIAGSAPFRDFLFFQLPRLLSGEAFAFFKETVEGRAANGSIFGLPYRLELLGLVRHPDRIAPVLNRIYTAGLVVLTVFLAWKGPQLAAPTEPHDDRARVARALVWVAVLNLAALQSPFAPPYVRLGTLWGLTIWAPWGQGGWKTAVIVAAGWVGITLVIPKPLGLLLATGFMAQAAHLGINLAMLRWALHLPATARPQTSPLPSKGISS